MPDRKRGIGLATLFVVGLGLAGCDDSTPATADPKDGAAVETGGPRPGIDCENPLADFGDLLQGEVRTHNYVLVNRSARDVFLSKIETNCGCALAKIIRESGETVVPLPGVVQKQGLLTLAPGESCQVVLELNSMGQEAGRLEKEVKVYSSPPANAILRLRMRADISRAFLLDKAAVTFGTVRCGETPTRRLRVKSALPVDVAIVGWKDVPEYLAVHHEESRDSDGAQLFLVDFQLLECAPAGYLQPTVAARLDHKTFRSLPVQVFAEVASRIRFDTGEPDNRELIDFGVLKPGEPTTRQIDILNTQPDRPYEVEAVEVESKHASMIRTELVTIDPGVHYRVDVEARLTDDVRWLRGFVLIRSHHPDQPLKKITFQGWIEKH